jgi:hypothetical protein
MPLQLRSPTMCNALFKNTLRASSKLQFLVNFLPGAALWSFGRIDTFTGVGCVSNTGTLHSCRVFASGSMPMPMHINLSCPSSAGATAADTSTVTHKVSSACNICRVKRVRSA